MQNAVQSSHVILLQQKLQKERISFIDVQMMKVAINSLLSLVDQEPDIKELLDQANQKIENFVLVAHRS